MRALSKTGHESKVTGDVGLTDVERMLCNGFEVDVSKVRDVAMAIEREGNTQGPEFLDPAIIQQLQQLVVEYWPWIQNVLTVSQISLYVAAAIEWARRKLRLGKESLKDPGSIAKFRQTVIEYFDEKKSEILGQYRDGYISEPDYTAGNAGLECQAAFLERSIR